MDEYEEITIKVNRVLMDDIRCGLEKYEDMTIDQFAYIAFLNELDKFENDWIERFNLDIDHIYCGPDCKGEEHDGRTV
jgi:hypothetical protein